MTILIPLTTFVLSWLLPANAGELCTPMETGGMCGSVHRKGLGAALMQMQTSLHSTTQVIADESASQPTLQPTPQPTPQVSPACTEFITVSSTTIADEDFWTTQCSNISGSTKMIRVDMGNVTDYYKPNAGVTWCNMLVSGNLFEWSSTGNDWETPSYYDKHDAFGGSSKFWPYENQAHPDDQRRFLSFWGSGNGAMGGCCKPDYDYTVGGWGEPFTMYTCRQGEDDEAIHAFVEKYKEGQAAENELTCEQLKDTLFNETAQNVEKLTSHCSAECDFSQLDVGDIFMQQEKLTAIVTSADKKNCLPFVMGAPEVQQKLADLLLIVPAVLQSAPTEEGRARIHEAYLQLVSFQKGVLSLADGLADRQMLLGLEAVQDDCPKPCRHCDRHGSNFFSFRCLLTGSDKNRPLEVDSRHGVTCAAPKRRWFRRFAFSRQCQVADWKESALQHLHVSAMLTCASASMLMGVNGLMPSSERDGVHAACMKVEQGSLVSSDEEARYQAQLDTVDDVVPSGLKLAFNLLLVYGLGSGLGGLRAATRGNERLPALLQGGVEPNATDYSAAFAAYLEHELAELRPEDLTRYGDKTVLDHADTMDRLDACADVYSLRSKSTFTEGVKPFFVMGVEMLLVQANQTNAVLMQANQTNAALSSDGVLGGFWSHAISLLAAASAAIVAASLGPLALLVTFEFPAALITWAFDLLVGPNIVTPLVAGVYTFRFTYELFMGIFGHDSAEEQVGTLVHPGTCMRAMNAPHAATIDL